MKLFLITLVIILACCWNTEGHAGILEPKPRGNLLCNKTSVITYCGEGGTPCGPGNILKRGPVKKLDTEDKFTIRVFQRMAHHPSNGTNYYTLNFWDAAGSVWALAKEQQTNVKDNVMLKWDVKVPKNAVKGPAFVQMIFNATVGGGDVYYTCSDVDIKDSAAITVAVPFVLLAGLVSLLAFGI